MENKSHIAENKMGVMPIGKLLINMSFPMMLSMLVQALYNIVDSIFVAQINENALTAVSLAFPLQTLMIAIGGGTGVGVNALLSKALGEKDYQKANKAAINGVFLAGVSYVLFLLIGLFAVTPFYASQTNDAQIMEYGRQYMIIVCCFSFGLYTQLICERLLQSTGKTFHSMITQGVGAIINIILDPILIFGYFGFPEMGVAGAAVATVIGQIIGGIVGVILNIKKNTEIKLHIKGFRPDIQIIGSIYAVGLPSIIMQSIGSVMTYGMNQILMAFTSTAAAVFGVYFKLQSFIFMPVFGLNNGMIPIIAYNYGAGRRDRLLKTIKLSVIFATGIMCVGFLAFQLFPARLFMLFEASETMLAIGVPALRIISISFLLAGFCIIIGSVFQALGNGMYSMWVSLTRQLVVLLPVAWLLAKLGNVDYVWLSFPIAEIASLTMTIIFYIKIKKNVISHIGKG